MTHQLHLLCREARLTVPHGENLLKALLDGGIEVPHLCWHHHLSPSGACRLCLVQIHGQTGWQAACTLKVEKDLDLTVFSPELEAARRRLLLLLMSENRAPDDPASRNELKELADRYGICADDIQEMGLRSLHSQIDRQSDFTSPVLDYDAARCILCHRCLKACAEVQGKGVIGLMGRGTSSWMAAGLPDWLRSECDGCGECVQACPTGALVETPHQQTIHLARTEKTVRTTCGYCGVGCQMDLLVQDNRILRVNGAEDLWPNQGRLCVKGRFGFDFAASSDRLTRPLLRGRNGFEPISWDAAITLMADRFSRIRQEHGASALAAYASAKCSNEDNYLFQRVVRTAFGTNNLDYCTRLCHASTVTAMLKTIGDGAGSLSIGDFAMADCLLVTGNNMVETHPVTATFLKEGRRKGAGLIVIDPRWTPLAEQADVWLQPRLGSDVALLNGMIQVIFDEGLYDETFIRNRVAGGMEALKTLRETVFKLSMAEIEARTGVHSRSIRQAALLYGRARRAIIATGMGMSQQQTGTDNVLALIDLMLLCGQIGKAHAGIAPPRGQNNVQGATDVGVSPLFFPGYISVRSEDQRRHLAQVWNLPPEQIPNQPGLTTVEIAQAIHRREIRGLWVMGENPMLTDPNLTHTEAAFQGLDFMVVQDIFMTETARLAHLVLPAACFAEKNGTVVSSDRRVLRLRPALSPPGQALPDWQIIWRLGRAMGLTLPDYADESDIFDEIARVTPIFGGLSYPRLEHEGLQWPCPTPDHPGTPTLFLEGFNTPDGKARMIPVEPLPPAEVPDETHPFLLNTGRLLYQYHSSTLSRRCEPLNAYAPEAYMLMHPLDAADLEIGDGSRVRVTSKQGTLEVRVRLDEGVRQKELFIPFHYHESPVNRLTRDVLDPYSKIAPLKLTACRVEKVPLI